MNNKILQELLDEIEREYGSLDDECGCYVNDEWLSVKKIVGLIRYVDRR